MKAFKTKKGAALVSILIAATFLTIIGSTVLILAANNYSMKAMSLNSKNNYYETERDINALTAKIRSGLTGASISASADCKMLLGVDENNRYDCMALARLVYPDNVENAGYKVSGTKDKAIVTLTEDSGREVKLYITSGTNPGKPNYIYSTSTSGMIDKLTIKDVCVSRETSDNYENTIMTDIEIYVERTMPKANIDGIGSFSLIMDAPLQLDSNTRLNMYGSAYIADYSFNGTMSEPGDGAIVLSNSAQLHMLGSHNVIYGDIVLHDKSVLNVIGGDLSVFGNIYVLDNAALIMNENSTLYMAEGYELHTVPTSENNVLPITLIDDVASSVEIISLRDFEFFKTFMGLNDGSRYNDGLIATMCEENKPLDALNGEKAYFYEMGINGQSRTESEFFGEPIRTIVYNERQINESAEYALVLNSYASEIVCSNPKSTIISTVPLAVRGVSNLSLTSFGAERYAHILMKDRLNAQYDPYACEMRCNIPYSKENPNWSTGNLTCQVGGFFKEEVDDVINGVLGIATNSSGLNTKPKTVAGYANFRKDDDE